MEYPPVFEPESYSISSPISDSVPSHVSFTPLHSTDGGRSTDGYINMRDVRIGNTPQGPPLSTSQTIYVTSPASPPNMDSFNHPDYVTMAGPVPVSPYTPQPEYVNTSNVMSQVNVSVMNNHISDNNRNVYCSPNTMGRQYEYRQ